MICGKFENMKLYCQEVDVLHKAISYGRAFDLSLFASKCEVKRVSFLR
jgi:hypothetical protein